jgi:hypothetical protein
MVLTQSKHQQVLHFDFESSGISIVQEMCQGVAGFADRDKMEGTTV